MRHSLSAGIHRAAYIDSTDPETTLGGTSLLQAGVLWLDTTRTPHTLKKRNSGNTGWDSLEVGQVDLATWIIGEPTASQIVFRFIAVRALHFPASLTGSQAKAGVAATGSTVFDIQKNGSSVGSITFSASGTTGAFSAASAISLAAGDVLSIVAPGTPDATLADISITLKGD